MISELISLIKDLYPNENHIPLYRPAISAVDNRYILEALEERYVASTSPIVEAFEAKLAAYTGAKHVIATQSGTSALHLSLLAAGVKPGELVITQPLSFVATCNAIRYTGADPLFIDIDEYRLCLNTEYLDEFFQFETHLNDDGQCIHNNSGKRIAACLPVHQYGIPGPVQEIHQLCQTYHVPLIEDAAEALGSFDEEGCHCGTTGELGVLSFNGNKIITCGNGGAILTQNDQLAAHVRHMSTQAKIPHPYEYLHDNVGYNYRLSAIEAGLGLSQLERIEDILQKKKELAGHYFSFCGEKGIRPLQQPPHCTWNHWLPGMVLEDFVERHTLLEQCNSQGINTRAIWKRINTLPMYHHCISYSTDIAKWMEDRVVLLPGWVT